MTQNIKSLKLTHLLWCEPEHAAQRAIFHERLAHKAWLLGREICKHGQEVVGVALLDVVVGLEIPNLVAQVRHGPVRRNAKLPCFGLQLRVDDRHLHVPRQLDAHLQVCLQPRVGEGLRAHAGAQGVLLLRVQGVVVRRCDGTDPDEAVAGVLMENDRVAAARLGRGRAAVRCPSPSL